MKIEIWKQELRKVKDLIPCSKNPRTITKERFEKLRERIEKEGFRVPPCITIDNKMLTGHQRTKVLLEQGLGDLEIPVSIATKKLTKKQEEEIILADNQSWGDYDFDIITNEFDFSLDEMKDLGFDDFDLGLDEDEPEIEEYEVPELKEESIVKKGDVWLLGRHRLLCGDSTIITDIEKLMDGGKADFIYNDPPYGMGYDPSMCDTIKPKGEWSNKVKNYSKVIGDDKDYDPSFLMEYFKYCKEQFWWGADYYAERILNKNSGSWIVWDKRAGVEDLKWTTSEFELCYSKQKHHRKIARIRWHGLLGMEKDDTKSRVHPTQKPTELARWFFENWGKKNDLVVDLYGGSGSTLIACEQTNRKCFMMEIDEHYCQVIIDRYINLKQNNGDDVYLMRDGEKVAYKKVAYKEVVNGE